MSKNQVITLEAARAAGQALKQVATSLKGLEDQYYFFFYPLVEAHLILEKISVLQQVFFDKRAPKTNTILCLP